MLLVLGFVLCAAGCSAPVPAPGQRVELLVSAAASLREALEDAATRFAAAHPGVGVRLNSGASGVLLQQALHGAPVDVLVSASPEEIARLRDAGRVEPGSETPVAANVMVLLVGTGPTARRDAPRSLRDLLDPAYGRIAAANPRTAPAGRYAEQWLRREGVWEALAPRLVLGESARQALEYVARGEAEAGLLYRTDAAIAGARVRVALVAPPGSHEPILYRAAVLRDARAPRAAREFLAYLSSAEGRATLAAHGFLPPAGSP